MDTSTKSFTSYAQLFESCQELERSNSIITAKSLEISFLPYLSDEFSPFQKYNDNEGKDQEKCLTSELKNRFHDEKNSPVVNWNGKDIPVAAFFRKVKLLMNQLRSLHSKALNYIQSSLKEDFSSSFKDNCWVNKKKETFNFSFGVSYMEDLNWRQINNLKHMYSDISSSNKEEIVAKRIESLEALHNVQTQVSYMQSYLKREISRTSDKLEKLELFNTKFTRNITKLKRVIAMVEAIVRLKFAETITVNIEKNEPKSLSSLCRNCLREQASIIIPVLDSF